IEGGGTKIVCALADDAGRIVERARIATTTSGETLAAVREFFASAAAAHGTIRAFGVGTFGPIGIDPCAPDYGVVGASPKPGWPGGNWVEALASFGAPIELDTDVNAAALAEAHAGAGQGCATLAYTTVGTGIGMGLVHDGRSRTGFTHYEAGHMRAPRDRAADGFAGTCSYHGDCLEGLASGSAIAARWGESLSENADPGRIALIAGYLGHLAAVLVLLHAPDRLIFGGGVMKAPGLLEAVRRAAEAELAGYVPDRRLDPGLERYIVGPALGDDAGITGAILLARRAL
ncbi:MAG TPA: ROK family protein, partial [Novosphingobium sp.]|nr:ROK family protein [Novosphingobium sp.]